MPIEFNMEAFNASLDRLVNALDEATMRGVRDGISLVERNVKQNGFAGQLPIGIPRPSGSSTTKPYAHSENLKRSLRRIPEMPVRIGLGEYQQAIAPTMIYARRVELGFQGADSLGRVYNQPPYPYMQPALDRARPYFTRLLIAEWERTLKGAFNA
jgi:hypothetical protein